MPDFNLVDGKPLPFTARSENAFQSKVSNTFHGRDVFAPVAAYLTNGVNPSDIRRKKRKMVAPEFGKIVKEKKIVTGEILHVDAFGNVETKIARAMVKLKSENRQLSLETTDFLKIL